MILATKSGMFFVPPLYSIPCTKGGKNLCGSGASSCCYRCCCFWKPNRLSHVWAPMHFFEHICVSVAMDLCRLFVLERRPKMIFPTKYLFFPFLRRLLLNKWIIKMTQKIMLRIFSLNRIIIGTNSTKRLCASFVSCAVWRDIAHLSLKYVPNLLLQFYLLSCIFMVYLK